MKKAVSIGLFGLLLYHTLAYVLVFVGTWWQAEHDLSEQLQVYRSVDSIVEFQIPLKNKPDASALASTTSDGFSYRGQYYSVISMEIQDGTLHLSAIQAESRSFWKSDLLSFLNDHVMGTTGSRQKANQLLKFLLKEYSPSPRAIFNFLAPNWREAVRIPDALFVFADRTLPVHSPPPQA